MFHYLKDPFVWGPLVAAGVLSLPIVVIITLMKFEHMRPMNDHSMRHWFLLLAAMVFLGLFISGWIAESERVTRGEFDRWSKIGFLVTTILLILVWAWVMYYQKGYWNFLKHNIKALNNLDVASTAAAAEAAERTAASAEAQLQGTV